MAKQTVVDGAVVVYLDYIVDGTGNYSSSCESGAVTGNVEFSLHEVTTNNNGALRWGSPMG